MWTTGEARGVAVWHEGNGPAALLVPGELPCDLVWMTPSTIAPFPLKLMQRHKVQFLAVPERYLRGVYLLRVITPGLAFDSEPHYSGPFGPVASHTLSKTGRDQWHIVPYKLVEMEQSNQPQVQFRSYKPIDLLRGKRPEHHLTSQGNLANHVDLLHLKPTSHKAESGWPNGAGLCLETRCARRIAGRGSNSPS